MKTPRVLMTRGSWTALIVRRLRRLGADVRVLEADDGWRVPYCRASHILLPGGADIHPAYYGQAVTFAQPTAPERDLTEIEMAQRALDDSRPLFGICRGHQVIAVAAGGALYQDIAEQHRNHGHHRNLWHPIQVRLETRLSDAIGPGLHMVNSYHHQAIRRMPAGWQVAARAFDGVVEAIEHPELPVLSVQWHPEYQPTWASTFLFSRFLGFI